MKMFRNKKMKIKKSSTVLPSNSFWVGVGSIFNISGKYFDYNTSKTGREADVKALRRDWEMVGEDIKEAERKIKEENKDLCIF